jgi:hypothetical protein
MGLATGTLVKHISGRKKVEDLRVGDVLASHGLRKATVTSIKAVQNSKLVKITTKRRVVFTCSVNQLFPMLFTKIRWARMHADPKGVARSDSGLPADLAVQWIDTITTEPNGTVWEIGLDGSDFYVGPGGIHFSPDV